ncbi:MAG: PQQ-binding-like beta-propeller repeat protein [Acidobacteria bacterium]|nr:PQQ-binding-like beta-propeller repeat protein [Acidobacteriota bacterium]
MRMIRFSFLLAAAAVAATLGFAADWSMYGGNPQRTGWVKSEETFTKENVKGLKLEWKMKLEDNVPKQLNYLTVPVIAINNPTEKGFQDIMVVAGASDMVWGLHADSGKIRWKRQLEAQSQPRTGRAGWLCPNALNATPVIDRRSKSVYVITGDGRLHTLNYFDGKDRLPPIQFTPAYAKPWSLMLVDGWLYTPTSQGCGGAKNAVFAMNVEDPKRPVATFQATTTGGAGIWGRAGAALTSDGKLIVETGDGPYDPDAGKWADTFLGLELKTFKLLDYYTPANRAWITKKDLDMGCMSPVVFKYKNWELVAGAGKEGVIYLLDAKKLGGEDGRTPLYRSPLYTNQDVDYQSHGFWGAMTAFHDAKGDAWLLAPAWGPQATNSPKFPVTYDETPQGSIMAFKLDVKDGKPVLVPAWRSRNIGRPEPPVYTNGVVFSLASGENTDQVDASGRMYTSEERAAKPIGNAVLYALDAATGKELFSSGKTMPGFTHFSGLAVSEGRVFIVTYDSTIYAFGLGQQ